MKKNSSTVLIREISERAGVSQSTVSIVLNGRGDEMRISKKTQQLVKDIAREMDYHPNIYARRLRNAAQSGMKQMIAVFWCSRLLEDEMARFFEGAAETVKENKYGTELVIRIFDEDHLSDHLDLINSQHYNGIIVNGASRADADFLESEPFDIPVVLTSRIGKALSSVHVDNYNVGRQCAILFAEAGYRKAGLIMPVKPSVGSNLRIAGFREACGESGIELRPEWELMSDEFDMARTVTLFNRILDLEERPDCLFIQRSMMALPVYAAMERRRLRIPDDIAILGCGINSFLNLTHPSISMVGGSMKSYGKSAVDLIMLLINNHITTPMNTVTPPVFVFNDSFRPAGNAKELS